MDTWLHLSRGEEEALQDVWAPGLPGNTEPQLSLEARPPDSPAFPEEWGLFPGARPSLREA